MVESVRNLSLTFWLGQMLFFIVIFAPRVFKVLPRPEAAKLQGEIFPAYYMAGMICGVILLTCLILSRFFNSQENNKKQWIPVLLCLFAFVVFAYSYFVLTPEIKNLQPLVLLPVDQVLAENRQLFDQLHKLSVRVNAAALFALLGLLRFSF